MGRAAGGWPSNSNVPGQLLPVRGTPHANAARSTPGSGDPLERECERVPISLNGRNRHVQDLPRLVSGIYSREIARRPQQQTGADQQRERERRLAHRHEVQEAALAAAGAALWACALENSDGVQP